MLFKNGWRFKFSFIIYIWKVSRPCFPGDILTVNRSLCALQSWWHCCTSGMEGQRWTQGHPGARGWAGYPELQACVLIWGFPTQVAQAPGWSSGGYKGSVPQSRKHQLQQAGGGIAVVVLLPWPELHLSWLLLRKGVGVWAEQKGRGCPRLGEEVVSKDGWEGVGGEGGVQGWVGDKRGPGKFTRCWRNPWRKKKLGVTCSNN